MEGQIIVKRSVLGELNGIARKENLQNASQESISPSRLKLSNENDLRSASLSFVPRKSVSHLTNLELLTKVASRLKSEEFKETSIECGDENINLTDSERRELNETNCKPRKEKSLSILCDKFLKLYPLKLKAGNSMEISLDQATQFIGTDRRRIYDILIVLECLQMASKVCKNHYQWHGTQHLEGTLAQLKWLALRLGIFQNVNISMSEGNEEFTKGDETADLHVLDAVQINNQTKKALSNSFNVLPSNAQSSATTTGETSDHKTEEDSDLDHKDSSLGIMCQKFLMLFLIKSKVITLDSAAKVLLGASEGVTKDCHKVKTKVRRLYDIANVLSSLELIKKVNVSSGNSLPSGSYIRLNKKPAFQYIGPEVEPRPLPDHVLVTVPKTRHSLLGHPSHAACEKRSSRKRKPRIPCALQPKLQSVEFVDCIEPLELPGPSKRVASSAFSSGMCSSREKFPRSLSENCIGGSPKCHGSLRSDILQVAELELQRIFKEEQHEKQKENSLSNNVVVSSSKPENVTFTPKPNWRRYHSDNSISICKNVSNNQSSGNLKITREGCWNNSILKTANVKISSDPATNSMFENKNGVNAFSFQKGNNAKKDMSICIIDRSDSMGKIRDGKLISLNNKSSVPIVIHSAQKNFRMKSISINPVPISVSNCIMGPAYIIRQYPGSGPNISPVSITVSKSGDEIQSKKLFIGETGTNPDIVPLKS